MKEQAAVLQSLMSNYDTFKQIQGEFAQGLHFGSAEKENAAYVDSIAGKFNKLKEVWIDTLMVLADSSSVKDLLDVFIEVSEGINSFVKAIDSANMTFPVLLGIISGGGSAFKTLLNGLDTAEAGGKTLGLSLEGVGNVVSSGVVPAIKSFVKQGLLIGGVTLAVQLGMKAWEKYTSGVANAAKELQSVEDEQLSNISSQNEKIKALETVGVEYEKLANKANKTAEEEARMVELSNELAGILPEMVVGYDEDNNAILHMTDDMDTLIGKTKEAKNQYERLLLGTRMEQSGNALKMLVDGEAGGKDKLGLNEQKINVQEDYNKRMQDLQFEYQAILRKASEEEGSTQKALLENLSKIRNDMIIEESNYQTKYLEIQSKILEQSNIFRDEMDSTWRTSADLLINDLTPALENGIESFINSLDFSEISDATELEAVRKIFRELPKLAQSGAVDVEKLTSQISDINKEFANTGNLEDYNTNMQSLAKSLSQDTGWSADVLLELFTQISDSSLNCSTSLENFLSTFGKTQKDLESGDSIANALHTQFVEMEEAIESITSHDFSNIEASILLRTNLQTNENLPKQIRDMITTLTEAGVEDRYTISVAGEVMMSLKDGKLDEVEIDELKERLEYELGGKLSEQEIEMTVNGILDSFNTDEIIKDIESSLGGSKVEKEVVMTANTEAIEEAKNLLKERNLYLEVETLVKDDSDFVYFAQIIENLPTNKEFTYKFISENKQALSELETYQEVVEYIKSNPELIQTYKIDSTKLGVTAKEVENLNKELDSTNDKEVQIKTNDGELLDSIDDIETLIKLSAKIEEGKYKIEIDANTQAAIDNINSFKTAINELNKELSNSKTISYKAETAQAAKNISGLKSRINEVKGMNGKTFNFHAGTAQAAKNITGLINKIDQINKKNGKTFNFHAGTAQAAKNITGLINRIDQVNRKKGKTFTWYANTAQAAKNISGLINRIDQINGKRSRSFSYTANVNYKTEKTMPMPDIPTVDTASMVSPVSAVADEIASQTLSMQTALRTGAGEINTFSSNMARATIKTPIAMSKSNTLKSIKEGIELLQELENRINKVNNSISLLDSKMANTTGTKRIKYLKEQNTLYKEQATLQKNLQTYLKKEQSYLKSSLKSSGFKFNSEGNITNYEEKLLSMHKKEQELQKAAEKAQNKYNSYSGKNTKYKNQLAKAYEKAQKKADSYSSSLSDIEKYLSEYIDITFSELPKAKEEWQNLQNAIKENTYEIDNLNRANKLYKFNNAIEETTIRIETAADKMDLLSKKMELNGTTSKGLKEYISLLEKQADRQKNVVDNYKKSMKVYQNDLSKYGFKFYDSGAIKDIDGVLNKYQNSDDLEHIKSILEEYVAILNDDLPEAEKSWYDTQIAIKEQEKALKDLNRNSSLAKYINNILELNSALDNLSHDLDILSKKMELNGTSTDSIKEYISLLEKQGAAQKKLINEYKSEMGIYQKDLAEYGFKFNKDGTFSNVDDILDKYKNSSELEYIQSLVNEYLNLVDSEIPSAEQAWYDTQIAIKDQEKALKELIRNQELDVYKNKVIEINNALEVVSNELDILASKMEYAWGQDKLNLLDQQIEKYKEQQELQRELIEQYQNEMKVYQKDLSEYGFKFNQDGSVKDIDSVLNKYEGEELEEVKSLLEEYLSLSGDLSEAEKSWQDLENAIKDTLKSQLDTTAEIEDKITQIYKKQIEERIEAMNKEKDAKIKALKEQQDAYNKYREEVNYQDEYNEKLNTITELQKQLDIAMRDSSLSGQKKVQELQSQIAAAQKELEKLTQDKIDQNINDMFEQESNRIEEENEKAIEDLESQWSDSKIAEMVAQALGSGVFTDIDGNVSSLEDTLINFAEETGELFGVLGGVIEAELITNLGIARDTVQELSNIMNELDLDGYVSSQNFKDMISVTRGISDTGSYSSNTTNNTTNQVSITAPLINVQGNVDSNVVEELKGISEKIKEDIINTIANSIR